MKRKSCAAPAYPPKGYTGAFVLLVCWLAAGCEGTARQSDLDIGGDTVQLAQGVKVYDLVIRTRADSSEFEPARLDARSGDVVRFRSDDSWTHALVFDALPEPARAAFESGGQLRSPPLLAKGATWVVAFKDAPAGTYHFVCTIHNAAGEIILK